MAQNFLKKFRTTIKSAVFHRILKKTSCRRAAAAICPAPLLPRGRRSTLRRRADGNLAAVSHGQYVSTLTIAATLCVKAALGKAAW